MPAPLILLTIAIAVIAVFLMLLFFRGTDDQTRLLCRDTVRRLGAGYEFVPGSGFKPNRIVTETPGYRLEAALHPGRRVGWRLDIELAPRGAGYREPFGERVHALLKKGERLLPGRTRIERGAIRHEFHQGALVDADGLAEVIRFVSEVHENISRADRSGPSDPRGRREGTDDAE
jgi:hypothetical protein